MIDRTQLAGDVEHDQLQAHLQELANKRPSPLTLLMTAFNDDGPLAEKDEFNELMRDVLIWAIYELVRKGEQEAQQPTK